MGLGRALPELVGEDGWWGGGGGKENRAAAGEQAARLKGEDVGGCGQLRSTVVLSFIQRTSIQESLAGTLRGMEPL